ncbi:alpha/beta hydrolase [Salinirussus salinus]|jgi:predicted esterase|uniref:alpha/beta hydrolase n=1 Tax=Salinirussus salinus TaxID=1198300 RepID=UPI001356916A|nr:dienelactone hydrolase family protein [Salinirussus salinus]
MTDDPHAGQPVRTAGAEPEDARAGVVLCHGRGARAESMLDIARQVDVDGVAYLAPQAVRGTWYPNSFMAPIDSNEPYLSGALATVGRTAERLTGAGVPTERVAVGGFSQGACLATEYAARNPTRYGGIVALSGGLIGPEGTDFDYEGSLDGTPAFLGCSDVDPHIPVERVHETAEALAALGADVTEEVYEGMGHTVVPDELAHVRELVAGMVD